MRSESHDLLAMALMVGLRFFDRGVLETVFRGELLMLKEVLLVQLRARFGDLPASVVARVEQASPAEREALAVRLLTASSLAELGLMENGPGPA